MMLDLLACASKTNYISQLEILVGSGDTKKNLIKVAAFMVISLTPAKTFSFQSPAPMLDHFPVFST